MRPTVEALRSHLTWIAGTNSFDAPIAQFVLQFGRPFAAGVRPAGLKRGPMKRCYENSHELADGYRGVYEYAEGYAQSRRHLPIAHAWCVDRQERVIDVTLKQPGRYLFYGIIIPLETVQRILEEQGHWGILHGDDREKFMREWAASRLVK